MKLLIAEDDPDMQKILKLYLQREGCQVNIVDNGRAAIDFLSEDQVDLVILDWMMPVQDGIQTLKEIRLLNFPVKVLMLTAKGEIENEITGLTCGADDYLRKPFDIEVFLLRVKKLCRAENIMKYRELLLNPATMEVSKNGQRLTLTKTEFELLHCFLGNLKTVLSREWLLNHVWGMDYEGDIRTVDRNIRRLRKKIGEDYIRTRVGMGYVMGEENA